MKSGYRSLLSIAFAVVLLFTCEFAFSAQSDYHDLEADFDEYQFFAWVPDTEQSSGSLKMDDPFLHSRIRTAIIKNLTSKGYVRINGDDPDFFVAYHLSTSQKVRTGTLNTAYGVGGQGPFNMIEFPETSAYESVFDEGTLIVDIIEADDMKVVWRKSSTRRVKEDWSPEKTTNAINKIVAQSLTEFPAR